MSALHPPAAGAPMQEIIDELGRVGARSRGLLVLQRVSLIIACVLAAVIAVIAFDFALRLPGTLRLVMLIGGVIALAWAVWKLLLPALAFRLSLTQVALRVESVLPSVAGRLASSVEFASAGIDERNPLAQRAVRETARRLSGESLSIVVNPSRTRRDVGIGLAAVIVAALLAAWNPTVASTGLMRMLAPYGQTRWPARTGVESMVDRMLTGGVFARGEALPIRAQVVRGDADQRVEARYRLRNEGAGSRSGAAATTTTGWGNWQRIVLTHQGGGVHERLVDTNADAIEIYFTTDDDRTPVERIDLVPPPAIRRATLHIDPPAYAIGRVSAYQTQLGQGLDDRAVTDTASLIGSQATMHIELNKPLPVPGEGGAETEEWIRKTFNWPSDVTLPQLSVDSDRRSWWTLRWTLERSYTLSVDLRDEHGLSNTEPIQFRVEASEDRIPSVTITQPAADETVLPTAVIALQAEGRDDVGLETLALEARVQNAGVLQEEAMQLQPAWSHQEESSAAEAALATQIELASLHLKKGDTVLINGVAQDVYELNGARHEPARSAPRRLRVIDDTELSTQLRRQLGAVRQNAIRIEAQQGELQDDVDDDGLQPGMERAQAQISERIATQRQSIEEIERLVRQNRLDDVQLQDILRQTNDLLDFAGRAANRATQSIQRSERGGDRSGAQDDPPRNDAEQSEASSAEDHDPGQPQAGDRSARGAAAEREGASAQRGEGQRGQQQRDQQSAGGQQQPGQPGQRGQGGQRGQPGQPSPPDPSGSRDAGDNDAESDDDNTPEEREVMEAQQEVRDELADLIKLLDRDEDTWVVKRQLENISQEQSELEQATRSLGQQTVGQQVENLTERQRSELDRIADRQRELTQQVRDLIEQMRDRADALEEVDPQAAESMRDAANTAEANQLDRDMEQAAQQVQQNQMTSAGASQQNAQRTMQRMMDNMDQDKRAAAQQLLRQLASLIDSIQRLITVQENELTALELAIDTGEFGGLDRNMIRLNQNTQAVAQEARSSGQQARRVARTLDRAADAQGAAVTDLRAAPINAAGAREAEQRALELLKEAKTQSQALQQQTAEEELQRRREELIERYRAFAERQVALRGETLELSEAAVQAALDRRQLVEARRLGSQQEELRQGLAEMRDTTSEILDSSVFSHVHRTIDGWSSQASDRLAQGLVDIDVTDRQQMIADAIGRLIAAVEESFAPPPEFAQDQNNQNQQQQDQQGQQQQQQPLIPPAVQIKLLQGVQEQVYDLTKDLDRREDLDDAQRRDRMRDLGQQQRELGDLAQQMLEELENSRPQTPEPQPDSPPETDAGDPQEPQS